MNDDRSIFTAEIMDGLSVKGRGYLEAALKIAEGTRLVDEGHAEMAHLDGKSGERGKHATAGGRRVDESSLVARTPKAPAKKAPAKKTIAAHAALRPKTNRSRRTVDEIRRDVERLLARDPEMGTEQVVRAVGGNSERTRKIAASAKRGDAATRVAPAAGGFGVLAPRCRRALEAIQADPWYNTSRVGKELFGDFAAGPPICKLLADAGMIWKVTRSGNPAHTGQSSSKSYEYWAADPNAKIDVTNVHVPRSPVKDPSAYFSTVDAAIKAAGGWASKQFLKNHLKLSPGPLNRVLSAMKKAGRVKVAWKKHNPAHKQPKNFERMQLYWETT